MTYRLSKTLTFQTDLLKKPEFGKMRNSLNSYMVFRLNRHQNSFWAFTVLVNGCNSITLTLIEQQRTKQVHRSNGDEDLMSKIMYLEREEKIGKQRNSEEMWIITCCPAVPTWSITHWPHSMQIRPRFFCRSRYLLTKSYR